MKLSTVRVNIPSELITVVGSICDEGGDIETTEATVELTEVEAESPTEAHEHRPEAPCSDSHAVRSTS